MKTMKKISILLGATLGLFALASCQKEVDIQTPENNANKHIPFALNAEIAETKTTLDASTWQMAWENGDVLYAVTKDGLWGIPYTDDNAGNSIAEFTYSDGSFTTEKEIEDGEHTFYFLYTNGNQKSYHRSNASSFQLYSGQSMDASSPTSNLKNYDVLAGKIKATTPTTFVNVPMNHIFTLMKVTLKNKTGEDITINKFEMEAEDVELAGIFNVVFGDDNTSVPTCSYKQNGSNKVSITITNGAVANNGELPIYFVMAPLSDYSGDITFTAIDTEGREYTKTNTVSEVTFKAGEYNTATYSLKSADPIGCVELDWTYPTEGAATSAGINAIPGVTTEGLGTDYATSNSPYCIKFDNSNDYIQVRTDKAIGTVSVKYKMIGGATTSKLEILESVNGSSWTKVEELSISGSQNSTGEVVTTQDFKSESRLVKINFVKGSNIGIGGITIKKQNTDPIIIVDNISGVAAVGASGTLSYSVKNFTDDVTVSEVTGCVSQATASNGTINYTISPNYASSAASGTIILVSASNDAITKTINVGQLKSTLTVSPFEVTIPADANTASFSVTTAEFGYDATVVSTESGMNLSISSGASGDAGSSAQTVTVSSTTAAPTEGDPITLGTIEVYRNNNTDDPQKVTVVVKKAVAGATVYTLTFPDDNSGSNKVSGYTDSWTAKIGSTSWTIENFNNNQWNGWTYIKCGRKNNASVGTIVTSLSEAIKTVKVTVDAVTSSKVNSFKLYVATDAGFSTNLQTISLDIATGDNVFTIPTPTASCYYKLEVDCASGSSNGLVTISKVVYSTN